MVLSATLCFLLGAIAAGMALQWSEDDVAVMALYSADHYNKVSGEDAIYGLQGNKTEYITDENSRFHQLSFPIQETICRKSDNLVTDDCAFKEGGVVKSCTSNFFEEDDGDIVVVTCDIHREHSRVRRAPGGIGGQRGRSGRGRRGGSGGSGRRGGGGSNGGRRNGGRGRTGSGSFIAGGGSRGNTRYA